MLSVQTEKLRAEIATIKCALVTNDAVRALVYPQNGVTSLPDLATKAPPLLAWRIYDHCGAFTRLYAVYERFVMDIAGEWLKVLPSLYEKYAELPEAVRKAHRTGVATILPKIDGDRYKFLAERDVLAGIYGGLSGAAPYSLLPEAFTTDDQNLRADALTTLFAKIGIQAAWGWVNGHGSVQRFVEDIRGNSTTAESELKNFILNRNEAAHGEVESVVASDEIAKVADFILILSEVLAELVLHQVILRKIELGKASKVGVVIRRFSERVIGVAMEPGPVAVGDEFLILRDAACYKIKVESIEVDHTSYPRLDATKGQQVGFGVTRSAKENSTVIRVQS